MTVTTLRVKSNSVNNQSMTSSSSMCHSSLYIWMLLNAFSVVLFSIWRLWSWMLRLSSTVPELSKTTWTLQLLECLESRAKRQGVHVFLFVCLVYSTKDSSFEMMSARRPHIWSHFICHAPLEDVREERNERGFGSPQRLEVFFMHKMILYL